ncbi:Chromosome partition protein mukE [Mannheimia haemolytica]|uniref:Chromosome partition protein mukE n=1 Tax=Mannheimia haemolytica TaxID=75985 RepID=A0A378N5F9_MANHA|nr:Chromosome partition protein mukE [Mannheimia haemolytica]
MLSTNTINNKRSFYPEFCKIEENDNDREYPRFHFPETGTCDCNPIFPELDSQLRAGRHINTEQLDQHVFLMDFQAELESFYRRYHVELIRAPEGFFYLRPKASTLIARSAMSEWKC